MEPCSAGESARSTIGRQAVSKVENTKEDGQAAGEHLEPSSLAEMKVPPMIQKAIERHRRVWLRTPRRFWLFG